MGSASPSTFERFLAPRALLLGVVVSFLGCCLAGFAASRRNHFVHFDRFHQLISPESLYYPTACQVLELAHSRLDREKIAVIVGGSSRLHGTCQPPGHVWTDRLQALLGDRYQVLNLGLRAGCAIEFGATVAEALTGEHRKVILIGDVSPAWLHPEPDGYKHKYFFWDAYYKGLLLPHPARDARLAEVARAAEEAARLRGKASARAEPEPLEVQREIRREMSLDRVCYFCDLWNALAYTSFHTVWTPLSAGRFTRARCRYTDNDPGPKPLATRYAGDDRQLMAQLRNQIAYGGMVQVAGGEWAPHTASGPWQSLERVAITSFPEPTRPRTLLLVMWASPHYLGQLTASEQSCLAAVSRQTAAVLKKLGFAVETFGAGCEPADYGDCGHLTESGGVKLADAVAPLVRGMAQRLGYLEAGPP